MEHLNEEVDVLDNDSDIDIEIEDDTPEEDRGREPLANAEEVSDDELSQYSTKVQKRINEVNRKYHDERRAKEAIARQSAEAVNYAKAVLEENNRLKETLTWGEKALIEQAQQKLVYDTVIAEAQYKRAYEDNDSEALVMAQRELYRVQTEADQLKNYRPAQQNLQSPQVPAYTEYQQPVEKPRDPKAETWAAKNSWFGQDREMTNLAYAVHENLVNAGVNPITDPDYYVQIDKRMREVFPDRFKGATRNGTVVAPASRTMPSKKVTLSSTQVAIAKRLGVSLQDYARQVAKLQ